NATAMIHPDIVRLPRQKWCLTPFFRQKVSDTIFCGERNSRCGPISKVRGSSQPRYTDKHDRRINGSNPDGDRPRFPEAACLASHLRTVNLTAGTGMKIGRNAPCPCGSGKKYKHCCLNAAAKALEASEELLVFRRARRALEGFPPRLLNFADDVYGEIAVHEAWEEFLLGPEDDEEAEFDPMSPFLPVFMPWFFHHWTPDIETEVADRSLDGQSPTAEFLRRRGERLEPMLRRYLEACLEAPFSFH